MSLQVSSFESLVGAIADVHQRLQSEAIKAVNTALTLRNWLIGLYIHEYELGGQDRAAYGEMLIERLSNRLRERGVPRIDGRELRRYRLFYRTYPQIRESLPPEFAHALPDPQANVDLQEALTPMSLMSGMNILYKLSFTHLVELLAIEDPLKRAFYEVQSIQGGWSVRELKRQIASLLYERTGLSRNKAATVALAQASTEPDAPAHLIRDPYVFEFLGLKPAEVMSESTLEHALLDKLQAFLLELGRGFCFEARQKRLLIGGEHFFVDLVFYHRLLKCHVLIELKVSGFSHEHLGQLNTYLNWFRAHEMVADDNPPVGILLCTETNHTLVEYALAGMDNHLFVSKYQLALPDKEEMRRFLEAQMAEELGSDAAENAEGCR
jgi:predicted nuclease of restriction endonuclease-like (RecB) superfamily